MDGSKLTIFVFKTCIKNTKFGHFYYEGKIKNSDKSDTNNSYKCCSVTLIHFVQYLIYTLTKLSPYAPNHNEISVCDRLKVALCMQNLISDGFIKGHKDSHRSVLL